MDQEKKTSTCSAGSSNEEFKKVRSSGKYGELYVIGCNGRLPTGKQGPRRRSKFILQKREIPNGVKRARSSVVQTPQSTQVVRDPSKFTICYAISEQENVIVEYIADEKTDMFQIGRDENEAIDFLILDKYDADKGKVHQSNVSRFACRIIVERSNPTNVKIYAAGFDANRNIFLGDKAVKWKKNEDMDALTSNGVLLSNPEGTFCGGELENSVWREVSVCGNIFSLRSPRSSPGKGREINKATNLLKDGSLIDLCGVTLLWRTTEGLNKCPTKEYIEGLIDKLSDDLADIPAAKSRCFVIPRNFSCRSDDKTKIYPFIYWNCGHVHGGNSLPSECPSCSLFGPSQKLCMGMEAGFYVDDVTNDSPNKLYVFNPCGHITTETTARFWSKAQLPHGATAFRAVCPFCACEVQGYPGFILLKFSVDST